MPRPVRIAFVVSIVLCILSIIGLLQSPASLLGIAIYGWAAIGLRKSSLSAAFGPAVWNAVSIPATIPALFKLRNSPEFVPYLIWPAIALVLAWIYFRAGKALRSDGRTLRGAIPWMAMIAILQIVGGVIFLFGTTFIIPTSSMEATLLIGDHIFVSSWDGSNAVRGDLVVFKYPADRTQTFIKRIVGISGDRIRIVNKQLYVNNVAVREPYVSHNTDYVDSYRDNFPTEPNTRIENSAIDMLQNHMLDRQIVVPAKAYFVMGDNRDASLDSRYFGFVPQDDILGKPEFIYWSLDTPIEALGSTPVSHWWSTKPRWGRVFTKLRGSSF